MYRVVETGTVIGADPVAYGSLAEATDALIERTRGLACRPGARIVAQRPRCFVVAGDDGALTTLRLRHAPGG